uniref:Uncharacterized protein n=1 Tax=Anguilla anguilla TaxID=7936 RepID=A0A0E9WT06_ANGAN
MKIYATFRTLGLISVVVFLSPFFSFVNIDFMNILSLYLFQFFEFSILFVICEIRHDLLTVLHTHAKVDFVSGQQGRPSTDSTPF